MDVGSFLEYLKYELNNLQSRKEGKEESISTSYYHAVYSECKNKKENNDSGMLECSCMTFSGFRQGIRD